MCSMPELPIPGSTVSSWVSVSFVCGAGVMMRRHVARVEWELTRFSAIFVPHSINCSISVWINLFLVWTHTTWVWTVYSYPNGVNPVLRVIQTIWCDCLSIVNITLFWCEQTVVVNTKSTLLVWIPIVVQNIPYSVNKNLIIQNIQFWCELQLRCDQTPFLSGASLF